MPEIVKHFMTQDELDDIRDTVSGVLAVGAMQADEDGPIDIESFIVDDTMRERAIADPKVQQLSTIIVDAVAMAVVDAWQQREQEPTEETTTADDSINIRTTKLPGGIHQIAAVSQGMKKSKAIKSLIRRLSMMG